MKLLGAHVIRFPQIFCLYDDPGSNEIVSIVRVGCDLFDRHSHMLLSYPLSNRIKPVLLARLFEGNSPNIGALPRACQMIRAAFLDRAASLD
jgi:hypothetical protein